MSMTASLQRSWLVPAFVGGNRYDSLVPWDLWWALRLRRQSKLGGFLPIAVPA